MSIDVTQRPPNASARHSPPPDQTRNKVALQVIRMLHVEIGRRHGRWVQCPARR